MIRWIGQDDDFDEYEETFDPNPKPSKIQKTEPKNDDNDLNPFEIAVILDVLFKNLGLNEVKKCRFVSSLWNQIGCQELSRRPLKPIEFNCPDHLGLDDKLGQIIDLIKVNNDIKDQEDDDYKTPFKLTSFSFNINTLASPQIDVFYTHFSPRFIDIYGSYNNYNLSPFGSEADRQREKEECPVQAQLYEFLLKISHTVQEITYSFRIYSDFIPLPRYSEQLSRTKFPFLRKISLGSSTSKHDEELTQMTFYSIVGQNAPQFRHLKITHGRGLYQGDGKNMIHLSKASGFMSKLTILEFFGENSGLFEVFREFGQGGILKLTKLVYDNGAQYNTRKEIETFLKFLETQGDSLKDLHIVQMTALNSAHFMGYLHDSQPEFQRLLEYESNMEIYIERQLNRVRRAELANDDVIMSDDDDDDPVPPRPPPPPRPEPNVPLGFPQLSKLTSLQINSFTNWSIFCEPIDFSSKTPRLEQFVTYGIEEFLRCDLGHSGDSVKSLKFYKNTYQGGEIEAGGVDENVRLDFSKLGGIFPKTKYLEMNSCGLPSTNSRAGGSCENLPFWMGLEKVVLHFQMKHLLNINILLLRVIKKLELDMNVGDTLVDDGYMTYLGQLVRGRADEPQNNFNRREFYEQFLANVSKACCIHPISFKIFGQKISETFKRDFKSFFPECVFLEG